MLGLAVAIDYALFIVSRYRHELREGHEPEEAAGARAGHRRIGGRLRRADRGHRAGRAERHRHQRSSPTWASAAAVRRRRRRGHRAHPAARDARLRRQADRRPGKLADPPYAGARAAASASRWACAGRGSSPRNPVDGRSRVAVAGLAPARHPGPVACSWPCPTTRRPPPAAPSASPTTPLTDGFGPGFNGPLTVVVDARGSDDPKAAAQDAATLLGELDDVASVSPASFNEAGDVALIRAVPKSAPTSEATIGPRGRRSATAAPPCTTTPAPT